METVKRIFTNPIVTGVLGLLVGVFIGLVILGWWLAPVKWTDAAPQDMRLDAKVEYLRACIDAYGYNGDAARAKSCYESLGADSAATLNEIVTNPQAQDQKLVAAFGNIALGTGAPAAEAPVQQGEQPVLTSMPEAGATEFPLPSEGEQQASSGGIPGWLTLICVGGLILAALAALVWLLNRLGILNIFGPKKETEAEEKGETPPPDYDSEEVPPVSRSIAAYQIGNDLFDEVYSIEAGGVFLGEYGVAIAEYGGVGGPKKVSAFEVWLFDKNNIPTTTKVLMSEQTYADPGRRQKLEAKGETVMASVTQPVVLQTQTLRLVGKIVDMSYGQGAAGGFFDRFVLELKVWQLED